MLLGAGGVLGREGPGGPAGVQVHAQKAARTATPVDAAGDSRHLTALL